MDMIQNKLAELLGEIDDICRTNDILYTLDAQSAVEMTYQKEFAEGVSKFTIYMTLSEFCRFRDIFNTQNRTDRVIEGMDNNNRFPGFYFRYTNVNTTYYDYNYGNTFKYNGIHINIEILRKNCSGSNKLVEKERRFAATTFRYKKGVKIASRLYRFFAHFTLILGRQKRCNKLYNIFMNSFYDNASFTANYLLVKHNNFKKIKYPSTLYTATTDICIYEQNIRVAKNIELQYNVITGREFDDFQPIVHKSSSNINLLISSEVPFADFLTSDTNRMKICKRRQHYYATDKMHGAVIHFINKDWNVLNCVSARLDMIKEYMPQKNEIIKLYRNGKFDELENIYNDYDINLRENLSKSGMTIYFDKEIHEIYATLLRINGFNGYAAKMSRKVPDIWRKEKVCQ